MKRNLLLAIVFAAVMAVPAYAAVTVEESTDAEYLMNAGYSQLTAEDVLMQKNRVMGRPAETLYQKKYNNKFVNFWRNLYANIDPAMDEPDRIHHDIHTSPSMKDL